MTNLSHESLGGREWLDGLVATSSYRLEERSGDRNLPPDGSGEGRRLVGPVALADWVIVHVPTWRVQAKPTSFR